MLSLIRENQVVLKGQLEEMRRSLEVQEKKELERSQWDKRFRQLTAELLDFKEEAFRLERRNEEVTTTMTTLTLAAC